MDWRLSYLSLAWEPPRAQSAQRPVPAPMYRNREYSLARKQVPSPIRLARHHGMGVIITVVRAPAASLTTCTASLPHTGGWPLAVWSGSPTYARDGRSS